jgi:hypothetical protein
MDWLQAKNMNEWEMMSAIGNWKNLVPLNKKIWL